MLGSFTGSDNSINKNTAKTIVETMSAALLICDIEDFVITYANDEAINKLKELSSLSFRADEIVGQKLNVIYEQAEHIANPGNLPYETTKLASQ